MIQKRTNRRGALTMELILIFPILMLLLILFYQVSIMLLTYHSLETIADHAAAQASGAATVETVTQVVVNGVDGWYYEPIDALAPVSNATDWNDSDEFAFRILGKVNAADLKWTYVTDENLGTMTEFMVEVKLPLKSWDYWLLPRFQGVRDTTANAFVVSAYARRQ